MDPREAAKEIKGGRFRPIYVLYGKDRYRISQFISHLSEAMFTEDQRELGIVKFDTSETPIDEAVLEAETPPFFIERKLVLIRDSSVLATGGKEGEKLNHHPETLLKYMEFPLETSIICIAVHADKLDERKKLVKTLKERNAIIAFPELDAAQLKMWMIKRAEGQKRLMTSEAADLLLLRAGINMQQLSQEVDKLSLHAGVDGKIDVEQVELLTATTVEEDVFALVDAIADLRVDHALKLYRELLIRREEPIKIAALIARQLRIMLQIKELERYQYTQKEMAGHLGLHPYAVKLAEDKSRKFQTARLGQLLSSLAELDYQMKTGAIDKTLGLELYLLGIGLVPQTQSR